MKQEQRINNRLSPFGLRVKDLDKAELSKAKKSLNGTGGFFASEELISKSFRARNGK